ncbi:hypothetical protein HZU75_04325 [Chitinibacter fontanus]|uniref:Uncharacterized protein n=1 Tax=Chitinibacter fontanus TaxID=1737446 RepID=A0A7D5V8C4_9NEIS|nr:hypothetical protein [Chitinibacter fontanus]QLI80817.1 hypothetical protein HZU75_04325 [Chitinibacter fontanus]
MQLFQQTQLATQQAYLRALHELESIHDSIEAQEQLIEHINRLAGVYAEPSFDGYQSGTPAIKAEISHLAQITEINQLIQSHGWETPILYAQCSPTDPKQTWIAHANKICILEEDSVTRRVASRAAFSIDYILTTTGTEALQ